MKSAIFAKTNSFIKHRLIELIGISLISVGLYLLISLVTYSPNDPNFIYRPENTEVKNFGGFYGSVISDFLFQSIGLVSFLITINFLDLGYQTITSKKKSINIQNSNKKNISRIFYILIYIIFGTIFLNIFYNNSFWLIDNGNVGFVGHTIKENIYYFTPLIENQYVTYCLILLTFIFFILSLSIKLNEINKILFSPFIIIKKIINFIKRDNKKSDSSSILTSILLNASILVVYKSKGYSLKNSQPSLPIFPIGL